MLIFTDIFFSLAKVFIYSEVQFLRQIAGYEYKENVLEPLLIPQSKQLVDLTE